MAQERKATKYVLSYLNFKIQTGPDDSLTYDDWEILGDEVYILKLLRLRNYHRVFPPMPETGPGKNCFQSICFATNLTTSFEQVCIF